MALTAYCTEEDIAARLSQDGVDLHTADFTDDEMDAIIGDASREIDTYCRPHYDVTKLVTSDIVNGWATYLGCFFLCSRKGNPTTYKWWFDRLCNPDNGLLIQVFRGILPIADVSKSFVGAPRMSNVKMKLGPNRPVVQRQRSSSVKPTAYTQRRDLTDEYTPLDYQI
jgi:hypothetical protein